MAASRPAPSPTLKATASVAARVTLVIVLTVSGLMALVGGLGFHYYQARQWQAFERSQDMAADQFMMSVAPAVWTLNLSLIERLMETPLRDPNIQAVEVILEDRTLRMGRLPDGRLQMDPPHFTAVGLRVRQRPVEFDDQPLGDIRIFASTAAIEDELRRTGSLMFGLGILVDIGLSLALYFSLSPLVLRPLRRLEQYAQGVGRDQHGTDSALREIRFQGEMESLRASLLHMVDELAGYRGHLEDLVAERTRELERTYRRLEDTEFAMNHAGISIQWIDRDSGRLSYVNTRACEMYGYRPEALTGMPASRLAPEFSPDNLATLLPSIQGGGMARVESLALRADGRTLPIETVFYLKTDGQASGGHYICFSTDISQRKAAEAALLAAKVTAEDAARTRSEFLANMSHEIRTPMNAIIGMSQLALRTRLDPKQRNYIEKVHYSATSLLGILNDILDFSKVESGRLQIEHIDFQLEEVLDNVCGMVLLRAEEKGLEFLLDIATDVPRFMNGDPTRLGQILINLAGNAVKFTDKGAVVVGCRTVSQDAQGCMLRFFVRDTGIGMSQEQLAKLFGAFSQADSSITRKYGGTGLGLAISKRLVELFSGDIVVDSQLGQGTTFTFTARFGHARSPNPATRPISIERGRLGNQRVLIVDDSPEARDIFQDMVSGFGFQVDTSASAEAALERLRDTTYDLLISDWRMPGMDGVQLIRTLNETPDLHAPRAIIMVSAYNLETLREETADLNLAALLAKPATPSALFDAIITALGHAGSPGRRPASPEAAAQVARPTRMLAGRHVLLVEDNPINQELAYELLISEGLRVTIANHGAEGLEKLESERFDCVLMDVMMPVMDGLEATRRIRQQARFADLPIIAMTAGAMAEERERTLAAGMNAHITKPIDVDQLFATLATWLGKRPAASTPPVPPEVPPLATELPGLDIAAGLKSVNQKTTLYRKLLATYQKTADSTLSELQLALAAGDLVRLGRLAHSLKGSSGTLGLHAVYAAAAGLEKAAEGPSEACAPLLDELRQAQSIALDAITRYLAHPD
ncbi:MAG: response regulator [Pseudomonadota bacterium]